MDWKLYFVVITVDNIYRIPEASLSPLRGVDKKLTSVKPHAGSAVNYDLVRDIFAINRVLKSNLSHTLFQNDKTKNKNEESSADVSLPSRHLVNSEDNPTTNSVTNQRGVNNLTAKYFEGDDVSVLDAKSQEDVSTTRKPRVTFTTREDELENAIRDDITRAKLWRDSEIEKTDERPRKEKVGLRNNAQNLVATDLSGEDPEQSMAIGEKTSSVEGIKSPHHEREDGDEDEIHKLEYILNLSQDYLTNKKNKHKTASTHLTSEDEIFGDTNEDEKEFESDTAGRRLGSGVTSQKDWEQAKSMEEGQSGEMENGGEARRNDKHRETKSLNLEEILKMLNDPLSSSEQKQINSVTKSRALEEFFGSGNARLDINPNSESPRGSSGTGEKLPKPLTSEPVGQETEIKSVSVISKARLSSMKNRTLEKNEDQFVKRGKEIKAENGLDLPTVHSQKVETKPQLTGLVNKTTKTESTENETSGEIGSTKENNWPPEQNSNHSNPKNISLDKKYTTVSQEPMTSEKGGENAGRFRSDERNTNENKSDESHDLERQTGNSERSGQNLDWKTRSVERNSDDKDNKDENKNEAVDEEEMGDDDFHSTHGKELTEKPRGAQEQLKKVHLKMAAERKGREEDNNLKDEHRDEMKLEEFLGFTNNSTSKFEKAKKEKDASSDQNNYGDSSGSADQEWEIERLRESETKGETNAGEEKQGFDTTEDIRDKGAVTDTSDREFNKTRNKNQEEAIITTVAEMEKRQRKVMTHLENFMKDDNCTGQEKQVANFMKDYNCTGQETQDRQRMIMAHLENFMKDENCTGQANQDRQRKIMAHVENFMKDENCTGQTNQDRQRTIVAYLENFMKDGNCTGQANQDRQRKIMAHLENFMKDENCTGQANQDRQRKIMVHLENFMKDGNCTGQANQDRQRKIMAHLENFMKDGNCTGQANQDRQRKIMAHLENFMKDENCTGQKTNDCHNKTNKTYWSLPKRAPVRTTYDPIKLADVHNMEQELLQAQQEANSEFDEVRFEMGRQLSGLETNLGTVTQLANTMDKKIGNAMENALQMTKEARLRAKSKFVQVQEAASAVEVIEQKVGAENTLNASRTLLSRLPDNPSFKSNKIYRQLLAANALITRLEGAKIMAKSRAKKMFTEEEETAKTIQSEAELIREQLDSAVLELGENTARELQEAREAKDKIREAEKRNVEAYRRASQALTKVERYLAKFQRDEAKLSKY